MKHICSTLAILLALAVPASAQLRPVAATTLRTTDTSANSLVVGAATGGTTGTGGIKAGQVSVNGVGIIGTDGRIPAISSTYFASLSAANLTGVLESSITDSTILARVASAETITGQYTFTNARGLEVNNTAPFMWFNETGVAANSGRWRLGLDGTILQLQALNDAENVSTDMLLFTRSGTTLGTMTVGATQALFTAGSAGSPSIGFAADTDVGLLYDADSYPGASGASLSVTVSGTQTAWFDINTFRTLVPILATSSNIPINGVAIGNTVASFNRTGSDGVLVDLQQDTTSEGSISVSGTTVAYNTFMGAHYTQLQPGQEAPEQGMVVVSTGKQIPLLPRKLTRGDSSDGAKALESTPDAERFVYVEVSSKRNQKGVYGLWHADLGRTAADMSWGDPDAEVHQVAALGLTTGWVTDTCGPIHNGDFLATSPLSGLAERQCAAGMGRDSKIYDPVSRDYTLGKALIDVDWSKVEPDEDGVRKLLIPLTLHAG